jgi:hypothetical protein
LVVTKNAEFLVRSRWKMPDILQIGLERRTVGHGEHAVVSLFLALTILFDFEDPYRSASQDHAGIGLRIVNQQGGERVAVLRLGGWDKAPIVRIAEAGHERLGEHKEVQFRIEVKFAGASARRF